MSYLIDLLILGLLGGTLGYAFIVDRRVRKLMIVLREMEPMVGKFSEAVDKTEDSVSLLKQVSDRVRSPAPSFQRGGEEAGQVVSFRTSREKAQKPAGVTKVTGKADLVRGFFETAGSRGA
ncbi:flagellar motor switch protein [Pseudooceanicola sp.]|uniref:flagellar motor switch protein n=1 Tax=Pseudooceanicola sp. TaxID=1914328 RepID=UPI0035C69BE3